MSVSGNIQFNCPLECNIPLGCASGNISFLGAIKLYIPLNAMQYFLNIAHFQYTLYDICVTIRDQYVKHTRILIS